MVVSGSTAVAHKSFSFRKAKIFLLSFFYFFSQIILGPPLWLLCRIVIRTKVTYISPLDIKKRGVLIISNHQSWYDPFIVTYHVSLGGSSLQHFLNSIPVWYPTLSELVRNKFLGWIIVFFGAYDIGKTPAERARGLMFTWLLLKRKVNVLIFPEGKCTRVGDVVQPFHPGISMIFRESIPVILVRMSGMNRWRWFNITHRYQGSFTLKQLSAEMLYEEKMREVREFYAN